MKTELDHLVVVAPTLERGMQYVSNQLRVNPQPGGKHVRVGTHNALLKMNDKIYLEVIAIDPEALEPGNARWFGLDQLDESAPPRLVTWVARTDDIHATTANSSLVHIEEMSRDTFRWLMTLTPDFSLPMNGSAPTLIQWLGNKHPCDNLKDAGCELLELAIRHPEANAIKLMLDRIGFESPLVHLSAGPVSMRATIKTPGGVCEL